MKELLLVLSSMVLALAIVYFSFKIRSSKAKIGRKWRKLPPGTLGGWPFLDDTIAFRRPHASSSLGPYMEQRMNKYGRIFKMKFLGKATIVSADPELNRFVLQNDGRLFETSFRTTIVEILGRQSMLVVTGDEHLELRAIAVNFVGNLKLRPNLIADVERRALQLIDSWQNRSTFSAVFETKKFAFDLTVKYLMGMETGMPDTELLRKEYSTFTKGMASIYPLNLPGTPYRRALNSRRAILKIVEQKLNERILRNKNQEEKREGLEEIDDDLLASVATNTSLSKEKTLDLMLNMIFAAHETSSSALCFLIYFLASSPETVHQLREEHGRIAKHKKDRGEAGGLTWDDYKNMEFTSCVINETLRLGNIIKYVSKRATKDVEFKGYEIPSGWEVLPVLAASHLDPSIYDDPQRFNPWRWQTNSTNLGKNLMAFSGGPRLCAGRDLAKLEMALFLHHLVRRFRWELAEHDYPVCFPFLGFTKGLPINVSAITN